jgi:hypothetical protein
MAVVDPVVADGVLPLVLREENEWISLTLVQPEEIMHLVDMDEPVTRQKHEVDVTIEPDLGVAAPCREALAE